LDHAILASAWSKVLAGRPKSVPSWPVSLLSDPEYKAKPERVILFHIDAWDVNCPQHIKRRYTVEEFTAFTSGA
jgi:hypothetical protein